MYLTSSVGSWKRGKDDVLRLRRVLVALRGRLAGLSELESSCSFMAPSERIESRTGDE
jgi:hypothetical protein